MKVQQLFEGPYSLDQDFRPHIKMDSYPSLEGLKRECEHLGTLETDNEDFNFWLNKGKHYAQVTVAHEDDVGQQRQLSIVRITFQKIAGLPVKNELQVHTVFTHEKYRTRFLAGALYILLARYGYSVVSDFEQWNGGRALWKKLAAEADARNYAVRVWSDETEDWIRSSDGEPVKYNAANLDDDQIWHSISAQCEPTTLLVLSST